MVVEYHRFVFSCFFSDLILFCFFFLKNVNRHAAIVVKYFDVNVFSKMNTYIFTISTEINVAKFFLF